MESHARKFEVLPNTKMLPCATICQIKHMKNPALGTSWLPLKLHIHSIASTTQLFAPCSQKSYEHLNFFNEHLKL
jgi:hypothetical protein